MKHYLLLFLLVSFQNVPAEKPVWEFGPEVSNPYPGSDPLNILCTDKETTILIQGNSSDTKKISVEFFNDLKEQTSYYVHEFDAAENDKLMYEGSALFEGKCWIFISHYQNNEHVTVLNAFPVLDKSIDEAEKMKLMSMPAFNPVNCGNYTVRISPDNHFFVVTQEFPSDKTKNENITISGFDEALNKLWTKDHAFDIASQAKPVNVPLINNNGDVFIVKKERDKNQYRFQVFMIGQNGTTFSRQPANLNGANISDIKAALNVNGQLIVAGFYSTKNFSDYEGMFYFRYDAGGTIAAKHTEPLNSDILGTFIGKKNASKSGAAMNGFTLQHIVPVSDGGVYFLAEKTSHVTEKPGVEHHQFEDIFVLAVDENGNVKWGKQVSKKQESFNDQGKWSSYNYWIHNDTLNILFNKVIKDDQLAESGKKNKNDEFGDATFAGSTWSWIAPNGMKADVPLTRLHEGHSVPMAINPELVYFTIQDEVILLCEDYFSKKHRILGIKSERGNDE